MIKQENKVNTPRILLSSGEPAGIGPNLCVMIAQQQQHYPLTVLGDADLLYERADILNLPLKLIPADINNQQSGSTPKGSLYIEEVSLAEKVYPGTLNPKNAPYVIDLLSRGADHCLNNRYSALVTLPVQKSVINDAGQPFTGHTEFFAEKSGIEKVVMMLATKELRVALVTTHLPLRQVADAITPSNLAQTINILASALTDLYGIDDPRIIVSGLNPHAGENGHLGFEEQTIIEPTIQDLKQKGFQLAGPIPADTLFTPKYITHADALLCMYHDQGLPTLKYAGFGHAANITLGLPFIRTSVDHGTALELAASRDIQMGSLEFALNEALTMAAAQSLNTQRSNSEPKNSMRTTDATPEH